MIWNYFRAVRGDHKLGQIGPKRDKSGTFSDQIVISPSQIAMKLIFIRPRLFLFGGNLAQFDANLAQFEAKSETSAQDIGQLGVTLDFKLHDTHIADSG